MISSTAIDPAAALRTAGIAPALKTNDILYQTVMDSTPIRSAPASGFCAACGEVHSLGEGESRTYALELMQQLESSGCIGPRSDPSFSTELLFGESRGQMFGVLECRSLAGGTVILKAFSGQYNGRWNAEGWVPPIPDVEAFYRLSDPVDREIKTLDRKIAATKEPEWIRQRKQLSQGLMKQIHALYRLTNFRGETKPLTDLFPGGIPTGTGDCCAPKLLNHAAKRGLYPVGLSEFYFGRENRSGTRQHKQFYTACSEKCRPILGFMLCGISTEEPIGCPEKSPQACGLPPASWLCERSSSIPFDPRQLGKGRMDESLEGFPQHSNFGYDSAALEVVHEDSEFVVVNKPSGFLSVPGRGEQNQDCVVSRIRKLYPDCIEQPAVHRLDMDTSGLMVLARTAGMHRELSKLFHDRKIEKIYTALLDGEVPGDEGTLALPFRLDVENRPRQVYDPLQGKTGVTRWKKLGVQNGQTLIEFRPLTGRTHQLRVHSASRHGLGVPIAGDRLYGTGTLPGQLKLHASHLSFTHPRTGLVMDFHSAPPFPAS